VRIKEISFEKEVLVNGFLLCVKAGAKRNRRARVASSFIGIIFTKIHPLNHLAC
jgi:hypothetical protein